MGTCLRLEFGKMDVKIVCGLKGRDMINAWGGKTFLAEQQICLSKPRCVNKRLGVLFVPTFSIPQLIAETAMSVFDHL